MKSEYSEFRCSNPECSNWAPQDVIIARDQAEYDQALKILVPPAVVANDGTVIKSFACQNMIKGEPCPGKIVIICLKKNF
ncbi:MAG: hypothetical protein KDD33_00630 [Bdellovibrionales bacterium]|nr:hypothetical protein [Bdellovibrionales bacterium]